MSEVHFYHLQHQSLEAVLPNLLARSRQRGWRALVRATSDERLAALDDHLWSFSDESFLAHGTDREPDAAEQPILLTLGDRNSNEAAVLFLVDGADLLPSIAGFERVILLLDGPRRKRRRGCPGDVASGPRGRPCRHVLAAGRDRTLAQEGVIPPRSRRPDALAGVATTGNTPLARWLALLLALTVALPGPWRPDVASAQTAPGASFERGREGRKLPADVTTEHSLDLPGRSLAFTATAGSLALTDPNGAVQAEIGFVAYRLKGADPATRPVTFAVNGGPGAASAYLHLLVAGPWRLPLGVDTISPSAPTALVPNGETWLDFTDLVFIDPVGTGYSRSNAPDAETRERYYAVEGDVASLSAAIARWLRENDRMASPKFLLGESYGGFRAPLIAGKLQSDIGIGMSGLVLLSPVLDFGWLSEPRWKAMDFVARLPSFAAAARERDGPVTRAGLAEVERYAAGEYLTDFLSGVGDHAAVARMSEHVGGPGPGSIPVSCGSGPAGWTSPRSSAPSAAARGWSSRPTTRAPPDSIPIRVLRTPRPRTPC